MVSPVAARQPSMSWGRYWIFRKPRLTVRTRWSGSAKATLARKPGRSSDQISSTGLRWGAYRGSW